MQAERNWALDILDQLDTNLKRSLVISFIYRVVDDWGSLPLPLFVKIPFQESRSL